MGHPGLLKNASLTSPHPYDYLFLSDVHLGSDLVSHLRPWATSTWLAQSPEVDDQLVPFLRDRMEARQPGRKLCLVIVGDFLELVGMSLPPTDVRTKPTREELRHGLGSAADHVTRKVDAIAGRHVRLFRALCEFMRDDNRLVLVQGNHDVELHWKAARRAFVEAIAQHAESPEAKDRVRANIQICPWFFKVDGLLYAEHGHEFDSMCSYGDPLLPTCLKDSRRIRAAPFSVMLRQVARPTRGLSTEVYEDAGFGAYVKLLFRLGASGSARIALRFARAVFSLAWEHVLHLMGQGRRRAHRALVARRRFRATLGVDESCLKAVQQHHALPAVHSLRLVLHSLYVDRIVATLLAFAASMAGALLAAGDAELIHTALCVLPAAVLGCYGAVGIKRDISPQTRMRKGAQAIARTFGVRWVFMGHTHDAHEAPLDGGATYVNLGNWGQDDVPEERAHGAPPCPCTFFSLEAREGGYVGQLARWEPERGVVPFRMTDKAPSPEANGVSVPQKSAAIPA